LDLDLDLNLDGVDFEADFLVWFGRYVSIWADKKISDSQNKKPFGFVDFLTNNNNIISKSFSKSPS
jgi:hypothetical protein